MNVKIIATNPLAKRNFFLEELVEAGIALMGTEIKSIRNQSPNLRDAFVEIKKHEAWLVNCHIPHYSHGNIWNHEPNRSRKLLLHRNQIDQLTNAIEKKGLTVIPTKIYLKAGYAKVEVAIGRGKKSRDKRTDIKDRDAKREIDRAVKQGRR